MPVPLSELASLVQGKLVGDENQPIESAKPLGLAGPDDITFLQESAKANLLTQSGAGAAVVPLKHRTNGKAIIQVADPLTAFVRIVRHFQGIKEPKKPVVDPRAAVDYSASLGADVGVGPFAVIGEGTVVGDRCQINANATIGANCVLGNDVIVHSGAVLYDRTVVGNRSIIHANAVLGADGFGYRFIDGTHTKVPQLGNVVIGDDVEIGAGTTIDRGTFQSTEVGTGTKIDNLVQIAHNCRIGQHNLLVSQMGIAGSSTTGQYVIVAGQVGIKDHVTIGDGAIIGAQAGVTRDVPAGQRMLGAPAIAERDQKRIITSLEKLPKLRRDVKALQRHLGLDEASET
ncbi:MAG: UDP-3-O-(3-hydroxymyristoyl)glucosamine N-acyltransferase [Gemmataceae bacterium]